MMVRRCSGARFFSRFIPWALSLAVVRCAPANGGGDAATADARAVDGSVDTDAIADERGALDGATELDAPALDAFVDTGGVNAASVDASLASPCSGPTVHVSTTGNDTSGDGSATRPFRTLRHATRVTTTPATIHLHEGTFVESETSELAPQVCLEGEGERTIVRSTLRAEFTPIMKASSPEGTRGAQRIADLTFDGQMSTRWAVEIRGRSDVRVERCSFRDFFDSAVVWGGRADSENGPPRVWATGNVFQYNRVTNSAHCDASYCRGELYIGGQQGMEIHHNTMSAAERAGDANGWPIKGQLNEGYLRGVKIYANTLTGSNSSRFDFVIELFRVSGVEVFDNVLVGSVDSNVQLVEPPYTFSLRVYRNRISRPANNPAINFGGGNAGVILEFASSGVQVFENRVDVAQRCVFFTPRNEAVRDVLVRNNLCTNLAALGEGVRVQNEGTYSVERFYVDNNTFVGAAAGDPMGFGLALPTGTMTRDLRVRNNIVQRCRFNALTAGTASVIDGFALENNTFFDCPPSPLFGGGTPRNMTSRETQTGDPRLEGADARLAAGSPAIDTGTDVGLPFLGAAPDRGYVEVR